MDLFKCGNGVISKQFVHHDRQALLLKVKFINILFPLNANNVVFYSVTRCRFTQHGNKFGVADGDGKLSLWQVGLASQSNRSFFVSFTALIMLF